MSYKIVKTIESGAFCLYAVPDSWENAGILRCPKFQFEKLRQDLTFTPQETWQNIDCVLVKADLHSFEAAETEIRLLNINDEKKTEHSMNPLEIEEIIAKIHARTLQSTSDYFSTKFSEIDTKLDNLMKNQIDICSNQQLLMTKIDKMSSKLAQNTFGISETSDNTPKFRRISPITDKKGLDDLEKSLENEETAAELEKYLAILCGSGKDKATNNSYAIIDALFDRAFLLECSWSGGSRGSTSKICFKSYRNVIDFFFQVIHTTDDTYTMEDCEVFFKTILRNALKRSLSKHMRKSVAKHRQKRKRDDESNNKTVMELENVYFETLSEGEDRPLKIEATISELSDEDESE